MTQTQLRTDTKNAVEPSSNARLPSRTGSIAFSCRPVLGMRLERVEKKNATAAAREVPRHASR